MQRYDGDKIQFDYSYELEELLKVVDRYVKDHPEAKNNKVLESFFDIVDSIGMEW